MKKLISLLLVFSLCSAMLSSSFASTDIVSNASENDTIFIKGGAANETIAGANIETPLKDLIIDDTNYGSISQLAAIKTNRGGLYNSVDFGDTGTNQFNLFYSNFETATVKIILDDLKNLPIAVFNIDRTTGNWNTYTKSSWSMPKITGIHNVYLIFEGSDLDSFLLNVAGFEFVKGESKPVESISLSKKNIDAIIGIPEKIEAVVQPNDATYTGVSYFSSDESIAIVTQDGIINGISPGSATITAISVADKITATCKVNVTSPSVNKITLNMDTTSLKIGGKVSLIPTVEPSYAADKSVRWTSSNKSIATVDKNGLVTAKALGTTTITATTNEGGHMDTSKIIVTEKSIVKSITINQTNITIKKGTMPDLIATIETNDNVPKDVTWSIESGEQNIKLDSKGRVIGLKAGKAVARATSNADPSSYADCNITVTEPTPTTTVEYTNPIVSGYAPDPSICKSKEGDGYFLINSSFTSCPGIPVYYSKNLTDWELVSYAAPNPELGNHYTNGGLWAPSIRYIKGKYYMIVQNQYNNKTLLTSTTDPVNVPWTMSYVKDSTGKDVIDYGIDPDLFEDADGKVYYTTGNEEMYEIDLETAIAKNKKQFWGGLNYVYTEGPHIYRVGGYYYAICAEGGTGIDHMMSIARRPVSTGVTNELGDKQGGWEIAPVLTSSYTIAKNLKDKTEGSFPVLRNEVAKGNVESDPTKPHNPLINNDPKNEITTTGHADMVEDQNGNWWMVFLGRRDKTKPDLARETFIAPVEWIDGWPVVNGGQPITINMKGPKIETNWKPKETPVRHGFNTQDLDINFNFMRNIDKNDWSLTDKSGYLTLYTTSKNIDGSAVLDSKGQNGEAPSWAGIRQVDKEMLATTCVDFQPNNSTEVAGLTVVNTTDKKDYGTSTNIEFVVKKDTSGRKVVIDVQGEEISSKKITDQGTVYLQAKCVKGEYIFLYSSDNNNFEEVGKIDCEKGLNKIKYTGIYIGLYASGRGITDLRTPAYFDWFEYRSLDSTQLNPSTSIGLNKADIQLEVSQTEKLIATISPNDLTNKNVNWEVIEGKDIIDVAKDGTIKALKLGKAKVRAISAYDTEKFADCIVDVIKNQQPPQSQQVNISLNKSQIELKVDSSKKLIATVSPDDISTKEVKWSVVEGNEFVSVNENGTIKAIKEGTAKVRVTSVLDNAKYAECTVTIVK